MDDIGVDDVNREQHGKRDVLYFDVRPCGMFYCNTV